MNWKDIFWPWGALKRERAAKWDVIGECRDARLSAEQYIRSYHELGRQYDDLARDYGKLIGRIEAYEATLKTAMFRDPKTGRLLKRNV